VTSKSETGTGTVRYTYDITEGLASGYHAQTSTDKDGITITDVYDRSSRLSSVMKNGTAAVTYTYLANGSLSQTDLPNGANAKYTYDKAGRLTSLINTDASGKAVNSYVYTYDRAGNMLTKADGTSVTTYSYDNENRLINVVYPGSDSVSYEYDGSGNRLYETETANGSTSTTKYFYDKANLLTSAKVINGDTVTENTVYSYDVNGNETAKATGGTTVLKNSYDSFGQLVTSTVTEGSKNTVVNNVYNGQGLRISKSVNGTATLYSYDENSHVTAEYSSDGTLKASNVYGLSLVSRTENSSTYYYLYNGHGDTTALMNGTTGSVDASYDYDVFGNIKNKTGSASGSYLYAGYSYDEQTGLYYLNARYYDPVTARFTSQDTYKGQTKDPLSLNRYTYCANEPIKYTDPTGHTLKSVYNKAKRVVKKAVTYVKTAAKKVVAFAKKAWGNIVSAARYAYNTVKSWVQNGIRYVSSKVQEYWDDAEDMCSSAVSETKRAYEALCRKVEAAQAQVAVFMAKTTYYAAKTASVIYNTAKSNLKENIAFAAALANDIYDTARSGLEQAREFCKEHEKAMFAVHMVLDVLSFVPGVAPFADAINAGLYLLEGDYLNAGLSLLSFIPGAAIAGAVGKYGGKLLRTGDAAKAAFRFDEGVEKAGKTALKDTKFYENTVGSFRKILADNGGHVNLEAMFGKGGKKVCRRSCRRCI
jgi:RHS repeat-associated protein